MAAPQSVQTAGPSGKNAPLTAQQFLRLTQPNTVPVTQSLAYTDGNTTTITLPQTGLAARLILTIKGSIVVAGTITGGTFAGYPTVAPFSILKRMRFGSNVSTFLRNLTGISLYAWTRNRYGIDWMTAGNNSLFSSQNQATLGVSNSNRIMPNANVTASTYVFNWVIPIDIAYNETGERALLDLQVNNVLWNLYLDWGAISGGISTAGGSNDLFNTLTGSGISVTPTITATLEYEYFENIAANTAALQSQFMTVIDQNPAQALNVGLNVFKPPTTELYTTILMLLYNNSYALDVPANASPLALQYAANQKPYQADALSWTARDFINHRLVPLDGR